MILSSKAKERIIGILIVLVIVAFFGYLYWLGTICHQCISPEEITRRKQACGQAGLPHTEIVLIQGEWAGKTVDVICRDYERVKQDLNK